VGSRLIRFQVGDLGIYAAVERDCPTQDLRRKQKPDGSWLPKVGSTYPGAISFWKEYGLKKYESSGLRQWHESVVNGKVNTIEKSIEDLEILYEDDYQIIGNTKEKNN
jgi:hypothetical protein